MAWWNQTSSIGPVERLNALKTGGYVGSAGGSSGTVQTSQSAQFANLRKQLGTASKNFFFGDPKLNLTQNVFPGIGPGGAGGFSQIVSKFFYSPLSAFTKGEGILTGLKNFGRAYAVSGGIVGASGPVYRAGKEFLTGGASKSVIEVFKPTSRDLLHGAIGGFLPGPFYLGGVIGEVGKGSKAVANFSRDLFPKARQAVDYGINNTSQGVNYAFDTGKSALNAIEQSVPNFGVPNIVMPSLPSISISGGGSGLGIDALLILLGLGGGYALGKRKRKKYKQRRSKKRHGRRQ